MNFFIKYLLLLISLLLIQFSYSQSDRYPEINKYLDENLFDVNTKTNDIIGYNKMKISVYEKEILKTNDKEKLLDFYNKLIFRIAIIGDIENIKEYEQKIKKILTVYKDKRQLGFYYFTLGYINHFNSTNKQRIAIYQKAALLIKKYGKEKEMMQVSYALSKSYFDAKDYKNAIKYSLLVKKIADQTAFIEIETFSNYKTLLECYLKLNKLDSAKVYLDEIFKFEKNKKFHSSTLSRSYYLSGIYMLKKNDINSALHYFEKSDSLFYTRENQKQLNQNKIISNYIKLKNKEIETNEKYNQKIILLSLLLFSTVLILIYLYVKIKTNNQLLKKTIELDILNQKLTASIESKNIFIDTIAHEIKTPINTIKSISYLFDQNNKLITNFEYINTLNFTSDYLNKLIDNFVQYNSSQNIYENSIGNITNVCLKNILELIINNYTITNKNKNQYQLHFDEKIDFCVEADEIKLTQILINLLDNSSKFTQNGSVEVTLNLENKKQDLATIYFEICDNGIGIEKDKINSVFEPFVQESKKINYSYGGFGIGLSIVKSYIEFMGGNISLESEKNRGTKIFFSIPFKVASIKDEIKTISFESKSKNILLVEDNKINQMLTKKIINNSGHSCDVADNGLESVKMVFNNKNKYNLVFMDIMMPEMDGYEALHKIKQIIPTLPIIALTSLSELNNNKYKFDDFLTKPIHPLKIKKIIDKY